MLKTLYTCFLFLLIPFVFYFFWVNIFIKYYMPVGTSLSDELNPSSVSLYFQWLKDITLKLTFGGQNYLLYGLFINTFVILVAVDAIFFRRFSREGIFMLICIAVVYFGMPLLAYFTHWFNMTTAKRGIFKMFPLMVMYMRNSGFLLYLSKAITSFEFPEPKTHTAKPAVATAHSHKKKKK